MGGWGGGKTTLASCIYNQISSNFDGCFFVKNIREESRKNGLKNLQEKILYGVLKQKQAQVGRVEEGRDMIKDRLHHRMVLLVLDDVDNLKHLEELAGSHDWFGEGSRIIITTRDEHVLTAHKVDMIHNINLLNDDEAMKLFGKHAPRGHRRIQGYEQLSKIVVSYAGGLPLALIVLGRFLCDKEMNEWRSALDRLKEIPDDKILEKLKISFDGLIPMEKELFLDIACFFRQENRMEETMMILDACSFHPIIGIKVLIQKALTAITEYGRFDMHDLVQEMAHSIVRGGYPKNPNKHTRVWKKEDVLSICAMDAATTNLDRIEAIKGEWYTGDILQPLLQVANMKKLRWFHLEGGCRDMTIRSLPESFQPSELCCMILGSFRAKQIWEGYKYLPNLRMIKLYGLKSLVKTPNFDGLPNLERFMVDSSLSLKEIDSSFGHLKKLVWVAIEHCIRLKTLPPITQSKKLETFILSGCSGLFSSSEHLQEPFQAHNNMNHIRVRFSKRFLKKLDLRCCDLGDGDLNRAAIWDSPNLQELNLRKNKISRLNFSLLRLPRLKYLDVSYCSLLIELSEFPSSIVVVMADECWSLESLGDISNCKWLWKVLLLWSNKVGPVVAYKLLHSMLQGNAKDYFISINFLDIEIWEGFVPRLNWGKTFTMPLPHDWYNDFCGVSMFVKSYDLCPHINIIIKHGGDEGFQFALGQQESIGTLGIWDRTYVVYISFTSLRHTSFLNLTYDIISLSLGNEIYFPSGLEGGFGALLVPRKSEDDPMQTTDCSEFWDKELDERKAFRIQHYSNSSIKILWTPRGKWCL